MDTILPPLDIEWLGDSLAVVRSYSAAVRRAIGSELRLLQSRNRPLRARPFKTVGRSVWELKISEAEGQFRIVYVVKRNDRIYVLHAFQKKTRQSPKQEIGLARARLKEI
jgi:phage-related protein